MFNFHLHSERNDDDEMMRHGVLEGSKDGGKWREDFFFFVFLRYCTKKNLFEHENVRCAVMKEENCENYSTNELRLRLRSFLTETKRRKKSFYILLHHLIIFPHYIIVSSQCSLLCSTVFQISTISVNFIFHRAPISLLQLKTFWSFCCSDLMRFIVTWRIPAMCSSHFLCEDNYR